MQAGASAAELLCPHILKQLLAAAPALIHVSAPSTPLVSPVQAWQLLSGTPVGRLCVVYVAAAGAHTLLATLRGFLLARTTLALQRHMRMRVLEVLLHQDVAFFWRCAE